MAEDDDSVGYRRPPRAHRFKPGQSGNPRGRPKGAKTLPQEVRAALGRRITVTEGGRRRTISPLEGALKRLVERAVAKGDLRAIHQLLALADAYPVEAEQQSVGLDDNRLIAEALARLNDKGAEEQS